MTVVVWTLQGVEDLTRIRDYIRSDSPQYADLVVAEVLLVFRSERLFENVDASLGGGT